MPDAAVGRHRRPERAALLPHLALLLPRRDPHLHGRPGECPGRPTHTAPTGAPTAAQTGRESRRCRSPRPARPCVARQRQPPTIIVHAPPNAVRDDDRRSAAAASRRRAPATDSESRPAPAGRPLADVRPRPRAPRARPARRRRARSPTKYANVRISAPTMPPSERRHRSCRWCCSAPISELASIAPRMKP